MTKAKTVYVPSIVLTDKIFPLIDNKPQTISARKEWELSHIKAMEWIEGQTRIFKEFKHGYEVKLNTAQVLVEDY